MLPDHVVEGFRTALKGRAGDPMTVERSLAHGYVMAVLSFERLLHHHENRQR